MKTSTLLLTLSFIVAISFSFYVGNAVGVNAQVKRNGMGYCLLLKNIHESLSRSPVDVNSTKSFLLENMREWDSIQRTTNYKEMFDYRILLGSFLKTPDQILVLKTNRIFIDHDGVMPPVTAYNTAEQDAAANP